VNYDCQLSQLKSSSFSHGIGFILYLVYFMDIPEELIHLNDVGKLRRKEDNRHCQVKGFDQKFGHTRIHHSLIVQHSGCWPEVENQPNLT